MADIQHLASLTEEDIKFRYITPAIEQAGWQKSQIRMEYFFTAARHTVVISSITWMVPSLYLF